MAFGDKKLSEIGFASAPIEQPAISTPAADLLSVVGRGITSLNVAKKQTASRSILNKFEDVLIDSEQTVRLSKEALSVVGPKKDGDIVFSPEHKKLLNQAASAADRFDSIEEQAGSASAITLQRVAEYRRFKNAAPELAPELRAFFKQQTGSTPIEALAEVEEARAESAAEERKAVVDFANEVAKANGFDVTGTTQEKLRQYQPYQALLQRKSENDALSAELNSRTDLDKAQRTVQERDLMHNSVAGRTTEQRMLIATALSDFNFATATTEEKLALVQKLNDEKTAFQSILADTYPETFTEANTAHAQILTMYDNALKVADGTLEAAVVERSLQWHQNTSQLQLWQDSNIAPFMAQGQFMRGMPNAFIAAQTKTAYQASITTPLAALVRGMSDPTSNPGVSVLESGTPQTKTNFFAEVTGALKANMDSPDDYERVGNGIRATTNVLTTTPTRVDPNTYMTLVDLVSTQNSLGSLGTQTGVSDNYAAGLPRFQAAIRDALADDMNTQVPITTKLVVSEFNLSFPMSPKTDKVRTRMSDNEQPYFHEVVNVSHSSADGRLIFTAKSEVANQPSVQKIVKDLNVTYGDIYGKLVRAHAHTVQGNTDYDKAWTAWQSGNGFVDVSAVPEAPVEEAL